MVTRLSSLIDCPVVATDGPVGKLKDLYYDDRTFGVRYLVVDTGWFVFGKKVLLSPYVTTSVADGQINTDLTAAQIRKAESENEHPPVYRQLDDRINAVGSMALPLNGEGASLSVLPGILIINSLTDNADDAADTHLGSAINLTTYQLRTSGGLPGPIKDVAIDISVWRLESVLYLNNGDNLSSLTSIPVAGLGRISHREGAVFTDFGSVPLIPV